MWKVAFHASRATPWASVVAVPTGWAWKPSRLSPSPSTAHPSSRAGTGAPVATREGAAGAGGGVRRVVRERRVDEVRAGARVLGVALPERDRSSRRRSQRDPQRRVCLVLEPRQVDLDALDDLVGADVERGLRLPRDRVDPGLVVPLVLAGAVIGRRLARRARGAD